LFELDKKLHLINIVIEGAEKECCATSKGDGDDSDGDEEEQNDDDVPKQMDTNKKNGMQFEKKTPSAPRQFGGGDVKTVGLVEEENGQENQDPMHIAKFY
jgi:hypothetical protein